MARLQTPLVNRIEPEPLAVPEDWKTSSCGVLQTLRRYWEYIERYHGPEYSVVYTPRAYFSDVPYPSENVTLHEIKDEQGRIAPGSVEYTMLKILQIPDMRTRTTRPNPDQTFEVFLPTVVSQIPGCIGMRHETVYFPSYSIDHGTSSCPSVACRPSFENLPSNLPDGFPPILFAANPVKELIMITGNTGESYGHRINLRHPLPDRRDGILELAKLVQPTLQLFVMDLTARFQIEEGQWRPEWNPLLPGAQAKEMPRIPEKYFVYGMNYDDARYIVYGFFPRYTISMSGRVEWSFCCFEAMRELRPPFASIQAPMDLARVLLVIQRHTAELAQIIRGFISPAWTGGYAHLPPVVRGTKLTIRA
ncbi:hypothetical protein OF83DRAFT_1127181 [Amylostereum chailletii]|nr:hypothetical protein OF83DRAFT_1127181 [Amylostereum chailletii]